MAVNENNYVGFGPAADGDTGAAHTKKHLAETAEWEGEVYQVETSDYVVGGANGIVNLPHHQLANRTAYLKARLEELSRKLDETTPGSEDYNEIIREIKSLDLSAVRSQVAHLERLVANAYLTFEMAHIDPGGYDSMLVETFDGDAKEIDKTIVDVTSFVSGSDNIDVSDSTQLMVGAYYQLTDGDQLEEVQIKAINTSGRIKRVILFAPIKNQYAEGRTKLYRSSIAITKGKAYGGGNAKTSTWEINRAFTGADTSQEMKTTLTFDDTKLFEVSGATFDGGEMSVDGTVVGVALAEPFNLDNPWRWINEEGDDLK